MPDDVPLSPGIVTDRFEFEDGGRVFVCSAERLSRANPEVWWWFSVSAEANARYAPFRAKRGDTTVSVQSAVVEYYNAMRARRLEPPVNRWQRKGPGAPPRTSTAPATPNGTVSSPA